jgi:glyoxylase-like metal-dependent hydrolase (beta-lactamase superfamily II)
MNHERRDFLKGVGAATAALWIIPGMIPAGGAAWGQDKKAAQAAGVPMALDVLRMEDDLHVVAGAGGNIGVYSSPDAVIVVDAGLPDRAKDVFAAASKLAGDAKTKILVNTHWHFDHVGGNSAFAGAGYTLVGSGKCRARLGETIVFEDLGMTVQPLPEADRPSVTFDKELTLFAPGEVKLSKIAPAHTDTDITLTFSKYGILQTGDVFFNGMFPVIDRSTGGSLDGMIAATEMLLGTVDDSTRIIPGHGPLAKKADLAAQLELLKLVRERLAPWGEKKTPLAEVMAKKPLADLDDKWGRGFLRAEKFTPMAYGQWLTR